MLWRWQLEYNNNNSNHTHTHAPTPYTTTHTHVPNLQVPRRSTVQGKGKGPPLLQARFTGCVMLVDGQYMIHNDSTVEFRLDTDSYIQIVVFFSSTLRLIFPEYF